MTKTIIKLLLSVAPGLLVAMALAAPQPQASPAPDFALRSMDETILRLSEYRSDVVVLNFWAPWCGKCRDALNSLNTLFVENREAGLQVLAIAVEDHPEEARDYLADVDVSFPVLTDDADNTVSRMYDIGKLPLTILIDREGNLRYMHAGVRQETTQQIAGQLEILLSE